MRKLSICLVIVLLFSISPIVVAAGTDYTPQAETLKQLGLFLGSETGFELERTATRAESAVMTVRLLGKEEEAKRENFSHPFTDVPEWAAPYVGYLYANNITKGLTDDVYGSAQTATAAQYATFVLRALGYNDANGDFTWDKSLEKMASLGILTASQAQDFAIGSGVLRGNVVAISYFSLFAELKGTGATLIEKLFVTDKAVTAAQLRAASAIDARISMFSNIYGIAKPYPETPALNSEEIFTKASDAVFKIDIKILSEADFGSGSGFFISSDGVAVTNMHVISSMSSASITTTDGSIYPVEGIIAINADADLAIIKVKGSGFHYLELGDPSALRAAQRIYCIGSPFGLDNSISDGLVSNAKRDYEGHTYIQISAPIAPGSSGGALLNEYGQVVGVTTLGFAETSINLAVPVTDLANVFRFPTLRSVKYLQAHTHFGSIPVTDETYVRVGTDDSAHRQVMKNDSIMYGTITSADDVHYYSLDVKNTAEMIVSLTSDARHSANLKFTVSDPSGNVILKSCYYSGEVFSLATGLGAVKGLYTVMIYADGGSGDWSNVDYELFWLYHITYDESGFSGLLYEFEPNDTPEYANYIPDYYDYIATISTRNDVDYYKFTFSERAECVAVLYPTAGYEKSVLNAEVFDSNNRSMGKFSFYDGGEIFNAVLSAGTYYIKVWVKDTAMAWDNELYFISCWHL